MSNPQIQAIQFTFSSLSLLSLPLSGPHCLACPHSLKTCDGGNTYRNADVKQLEADTLVNNFQMALEEIDDSQDIVLRDLQAEAVETAKREVRQLRCVWN